MQTASALGSEGVAHVMQRRRGPALPGASLGKHTLVAGQVWVPAPQTRPQVAFIHAVPSGQGVQSTPFIVPQVAEALLLTQTPLQRCQPVLHACTQVPAALQVTLPLSAGGVQTVHVLPHELMLVLPFATQVALAPVPHA